MTDVVGGPAAAGSHLKDVLTAGDDVSADVAVLPVRLHQNHINILIQ